MSFTINISQQPNAGRFVSPSNYGAGFGAPGFGGFPALEAGHGHGCCGTDKKKKKKKDDFGPIGGFLRGIGNLFKKLTGCDDDDDKKGKDRRGHNHRRGCGSSGAPNIAINVMNGNRGFGF